MAFSPSGKNSAEINVTPLIDILLVLLVTFLLITPITPKGENARIPQDSTDQPNQPDHPETVVLQLKLTHNAGSSDAIQLAINQQKVEWSALNSTLQQIFKTRGDKTLFLTSDREIDFRYIAEAIDAAHNAGVDNVALMTKGKD
ncbi:MAG TPA: biopolymer transporter ExbD [Terriglobales bacterium]|jgi:biopolymer transport protein TolR|nr:biopolymer transporter ExbD [Terriglobales bacterium]